MIAQLDLFGATLPAPPPMPRIVPAAPMELIPPALTVPWAKLLREHEAISTTVVVLCSGLYTGEVLETLLFGPERNFWLMKNHTIMEQKGNDGQPGRHVFLTPRDGIKFHTKYPLIKTKGGTHACFYRLARPGEVAPVDMDLPPMTIGPEIA